VEPAFGSLGQRDAAGAENGKVARRVENWALWEL